MYEPLPDLAYFRMLVDDPDAIPLLEAAASIGVLAYPALDLQGTLSRFDALAAQAADECRGASTEVARLRRLTRFFFGKLGFAGNLNDYYDPDNSFVHRVLETRRGIPITLALLLGEMARHVGLDAVGVAFPGHFLLEVRIHDGLVVIDPFTGQSLDLDELNRRATPYGASAKRLLQPASSRQILIRMLHNLRGIYEQQGDRDRLDQVNDRLGLLMTEPDGGPAAGDPGRA